MLQRIATKINWLDALRRKAVQTVAKKPMCFEMQELKGQSELAAVLFSFEISLGAQDRRRILTTETKVYATL